MGEMTLTFRIVELLKAQGIRCVASTTERIVTDLPDNRKETQFAFVQFREYWFELLSEQKTEQKTEQAPLRAFFLGDAYVDKRRIGFYKQ